MSSTAKLISFHGALYRRANQPDVRELRKKRDQLLGLLDSIGVGSAAQELSTTMTRQQEVVDQSATFLPLSDGRSFLELVLELANRAHEMGQGETPVFYDLSAEELQKGVDEALTGKMVPALKQVRQLFDELKQYPRILHPRDLAREESTPWTHRAPSKIKTKEDRELELKLQQEFALQHPRRGQVQQLIWFRGALYRKAEQIPLRFVFQDVVFGSGGKASKINIKTVTLRLQEYLFAFRTSFREDALVSSERAAHELLSLSQTAIVLMGKLVAEEREQRKEFQQHEETAGPVINEQDEAAHLRKRKLVETFLRLQKRGIIDAEYLQKQGHPPDLKPSTLDLQQLIDLLDEPLQEEQDAEARAVRRRKNLGLPEPKRKIWKDVPEVEPPKRGPGRPRKVQPPPQ